MVSWSEPIREWSDEWDECLTYSLHLGHSRAVASLAQPGVAQGRQVVSVTIADRSGWGGEIDEWGDWWVEKKKLQSPYCLEP